MNLLWAYPDRRRRRRDRHRGDAARAPARAEGSFFTDGDRASGVFGVLATCFAIFAGFVIFLAFTTYDQSLAGADAEALIVAQQYETAQFLPNETRDASRDEVICYARYVVHQEWPEMRGTVVRATRSTRGVVAPVPHDPRRDSTTSAPAGGVLQVARPDLGSGGSASRPDPRAAGITPTSLWIVAPA